MKALSIGTFLLLCGVLLCGLLRGPTVTGQIRNKGVDPEYATKLRDAPTLGIYSHGLPRDLFFAIYGFRNHGELTETVFAPNGGWITLPRNLLEAHRHRGLPAEAERGLQSLPPRKTLLEAAFASNGGWLYVWQKDDDIKFIGDKVPQRLLNKLSELYALNSRRRYPRTFVRTVGFAPNDGWLILYTRAEERILNADKVTYFADYDNLPAGVESKLLELLRRGESIERVAFAPNGGWVILYGRNRYEYDDIAIEAADVLARLKRHDALLFQVVFGPRGSWLITAVCSPYCPK